ncbi:MAG: DUF4097 domain-containing protein [Ruminococcaceae bacterium]|nr:DUF4097 domain-containing protein [Oscillospiraceae bacterium]
MTNFQKTVKYIAMGFAIFLTVSIILGVISVFGLFCGDAVTEDIKAYSVSSQIKSLEVEINAADLTIKQGESFYVESNLKHLTVEDKNGVLKIKETNKLARAYNGAILTLCVPADTVFEKANIITGAGRLTVDSLSASIMNFELGAGEVTIDTLVATSSIDIDGGAGRITVSGGALRNLDLDMGVGKLNLTSALTGEGDFDLGVGESNITVIGNKDDYRLDIEKGLGNITVDGTSVSNIKDKGNGNNSIEVSGGIGAINLKFKESEAK